MDSDVSVQLGMFGVANTIAGAHVVQAHTRVLASGEEVFVGEHLRWNRARSAARAAPRPRPEADDDVAQQDLFARGR